MGKDATMGRVRTFDGTGTSPLMTAVNARRFLGDIETQARGKGGGSLFYGSKKALVKENPQSYSKPRPLDENTFHALINEMYEIKETKDGATTITKVPMLSEEEKMKKIFEWKQEKLKFNSLMKEEDIKFEADLKKIANAVYGIFQKEAKGEVLKLVQSVQDMDEYKRVKEVVKLIEDNYITVSEQDYSKMIKMFTAPIPKGMRINQYHNYINDVVMLMDTTEIGEKITDRRRMYQLFANLQSEKYKLVIDEILATIKRNPFVESDDPENGDEGRTNYTDVKSWLIERERVLIERGEITKVTMTSEEVENHFHEIMTGGSIHKEKEKKEKRSCRNCGKPGHIAKDCRSIACYNCGLFDHKSINCYVVRDGCYTCGKHGHFARECPDGEGKGKGETLIGAEDGASDSSDKEKTGAGRGRGNYRGSHRGGGYIGRGAYYRGRGGGYRGTNQRARGRGSFRARGRGNGASFGSGGATAWFINPSHGAAAVFMNNQKVMAAKGIKKADYKGHYLVDSGAVVHVLANPEDAANVVKCSGTLNGVGTKDVEGVACVIGTVENRDGSKVPIRIEHMVVSDIGINIFATANMDEMDNVNIIRKGFNKRIEVYSEDGKKVTYHMDKFGMGNLKSMKITPKPQSEWTTSDKEFVRRCNKKNTKIAQMIQGEHIREQKEMRRVNVNKGYKSQNQFDILREEGAEVVELDEEEVESVEPKKESKKTNKIEKKDKKKKTKVMKDNNSKKDNSKTDNRKKDSSKTDNKLIGMREEDEDIVEDVSEILKPKMRMKKSNKAKILEEEEELEEGVDESSVSGSESDK
jgi:hypothetical protein